MRVAQIIDTFGTDDCDPDGSGARCPEWEHTDGWAYRNGRYWARGYYIYTYQIGATAELDAL